MKLKNKKYYLFVCIFALLLSNAKSQYNLVLNSSFEEFTTCSFDITGVTGWYSPLTTTAYFADFADTCHGLGTSGVPYNIGGFGYQYARTGNGYIVMLLRIKYGGNKRNYIQTMLSESLKAGHYYYIEFYTNLANPATFATNNIALLVSNSAVQQPGNGTVINETPQIFNYGNPVIKDTLNWVKVSGIYTAQGGERFITIGNFKDDANTDTVFNSSYPKYGDYYFDDVSVIPLDSMPLKADAGRDTTIKLGDSVFIGSYTNGLDTLKWLNQNTSTAIDSTRPGFWVKPTQNTCYVLTQTVNGYSSSDTVCVNIIPLPLKLLNFAAQQQLSSVLLNISTANEINVSHINIQRSSNGKEFTTIHAITANNKSSNEYSYIDNQALEGVNYYRLEMVDRDGRKEYSKVVKVFFDKNVKGIQVYPNPAKDKITIAAKNIQEIRVINSMGQVALRQAQGDIRQAQGDINIGHLPKGLYLVQVVTRNGEMKTGKLVVN